MNIFENREKMALILEDGEVFEGKGFGALQTAFGEAVFHTAAVGYQQLLTDPSNDGLLITQTFPLAGNYGVNKEDNASKTHTASGYIVREWSSEPSNFRCEGNLEDFLKDNHITGLFDIDTRALTKKLRLHGAMQGMLTAEAKYLESPALAVEAIKAHKTLLPIPAPQLGEERTAPNVRYKVAVMDFGMDNATKDALLAMGCSLVPAAYSCTAKQILACQPDGILISGGSCNMDRLDDVLPTIKELAQSGLPLFAYDMGHLALAKAFGATLSKMHIGHRGGNQPVLNLKTGKTVVTNQNHGWVVESIGKEAGEIAAVNVNDKSCEGIDYTACNAFSTQFIPDTALGRRNFDGVYERFVAAMQNRRNG